ncbi:MAG: hypothetical protein ACRDPA_20390 [Solirubrobacteraceae bacterium]
MSTRIRDNRHHRHTTSPGQPLALRLKVAVKRDALNRELATGAPSARSPELSLRASQLVSDRERQKLAGAWRRAVRDAHRPATTRVTISVVRRGAVIDAEDAIDRLVARLTDVDPIAPAGMALVEQLITDGTSSPLYNAAEPGTLRRQVKVATEALDPARTELPVAA